MADLAFLQLKGRPLWVIREVEVGKLYSVVSATKRYVDNEPTTIHLQNCQFLQSE